MDELFTVVVIFLCKGLLCACLSISALVALRAVSELRGSPAGFIYSYRDVDVHIWRGGRPYLGTAAANTRVCLGKSGEESLYIMFLR